MSQNEAENFLKSLTSGVANSFHVSIITEEPDVLMQVIRSMGYFGMIRLTALGQELVVTHKVDHGNTGLAQSETS